MIDTDILTFELVRFPQDADALAEWLSMQAWPFHSRIRLSPTEARAAVEDAFSSGAESRAFWVLGKMRKRVGYVRLFDLGDIDDGTTS